MNRPIRYLPQDLVSQIAAGEVVERPASVVKELIENALDADASRVDVTILGGGITLIEVADDGRGMSCEEAPLSLGRHATSKLTSFDQLEAIASYGFRGEALPSVASVSRLSLRTRCREEEGGILLEANGTVEPRASVSAGPVGTTLSVRDLFYNVPARRKFLRSSNTESGHITDVLVDAALSRADVAFTLTRDGRKTKSYVRAPSRAERVAQVFGDEELVACRGEKGPLTVEAYLSPADRGRRGAAGLKLFVNGRPIRDRALSATIAHAYGEALERGRYPRGVVYLEISGRLVDVNVHPQKTEVRFSDPRAVSDALYSIVRRAWSSPHGARPNPPGEGQPAPAARAGGPASASTASAPAASSPRRLPPPPRPRVLSSAPSALGGQRYAAVPATSTFTSEASGRREGPPERKDATLGGLRLIGQVRSSYLVCEGEDGLYVLDQHAVHERILLSELERAYRASRVASQALLFPAVVELSAAHVRIVKKHPDVFARFGLDVRPRGPGAVSVHTVPRVLGRVAPQDVLVDIVEALVASKGESWDAQRILARVACGEAIKPGERLQRETGEGLLRSLAVADFDPPCVHAKVIVSMTSIMELDRKSGRHRD